MAVAMAARPDDHLRDGPVITMATALVASPCGHIKLPFPVRQNTRSKLRLACGVFHRGRTVFDQNKMCDMMRRRHLSTSAETRGTTRITEMLDDMERTGV